MVGSPWFPIWKSDHRAGLWAVESTGESAYFLSSILGTITHKLKSQ